MVFSPITSVTHCVYNGSAKGESDLIGKPRQVGHSREGIEGRPHRITSYCVTAMLQVAVLLVLEDRTIPTGKFAY